MGRRRAVADIFGRVTSAVHRWRSREVRAEALRLQGQFGGEAIAQLRAQIAAAERYEDRRRLYRLHDEIARRIT